MPVNLYNDQTFLKSDIRKGVIRSVSGTRMCALTSDFFLGLRRALEHECGPASDEVLKKCGANWGRRFAKRFQEETAERHEQDFSEQSLSMFLANLTAAFSLHGLGRLAMDLTHYDQGLLSAEVLHAPMADILKKSDRPADPMLAGVLGGLFSHLSGQDLDCMQTECSACGAKASCFLIGLQARLQPVPALIAQKRGHEFIVAQLARTRA